MFFRSNSEFFEPWEIRFDDISLHNIIGEGTFGTVYRGALSKQPLQLGNGRKSTQLTVAVKMLQCTICLCLCLITYKYSYLTIRREGYGYIAHEARPNGILTRGPRGYLLTYLILFVFRNTHKASVTVRRWLLSGGRCSRWPHVQLLLLL